ncbi:uncharacterized mitochondrial protein AtMg00810-like [Malania oleifera]|uniref:uncharacterized mitochondrial protein AtMg00810-like n=1 Tax=Malania oleifera TaxID=397392 RepID=UPI0025ADFEA0|nr:uncharacterized mitochondrial protein AtMg00810-like [Malania oleifera]
MAMEAEYESIMKNDTWEIVDSPPHRKVEGFDVTETFAPTACMETIRLVLATTAHRTWVLFQMDVKSAFLNGHLKEEVYVMQPLGFEFPNSDNKENEMYVIIVLYVDDLMLIGDHKEKINNIREGLCLEFKMTYLGLLHSFLGIKVWQHPGEIFISQQRYAEELLKAFGMAERTPVVTPMEVNIKLSIEDPSPLIDTKMYRSLIGSLVYLCNTRPNISFAIGILSRFTNKLREIHWKAGMRVLKYIKGTPHFGISYTSGNSLIGYCDSDWAGDIDSKKSVSGYCFLFGNRIISWTRKKQSTMSLSFTEVEYKSARHTSCEAVWIRRLLTDIGITINATTLIHCDN